MSDKIDLPLIFELLLIKFYNDSLDSGVMPDQCKLSIITMKPKKGDMKSIKNDRLISTTPCIIKLFEKIIHKRTTFLSLKI